MMSAECDLAARRPRLAMRGESHAFLTLTVADIPAGELAAGVAAQLRGAPGFFWRAPVILDFTPLPASAAPSVSAVVDLLRAMELVPAGFRASRAEIRRAALATGLGQVLSTDEEDRPLHDPFDMPPRRPTMIVTHPVRSGQKIYAAGSDLVILSSVSTGAEVLADGCIHVYGCLHGAAFAGVDGDQKARIFVKSMDAERVTIAGLYMNGLEFSEEWIGQPAQILLADGYLRVERTTR